jgi:vacuolar-type H+-ATPase subunit F/Vma7
MAVAEFIGDEVSAAGYRLSGIESHTADRSNALLLIKQACERSSLVLVSSSVVQFLQSYELDDLLVNIEPPVLIVPDIQGLHEVPDIESRIHQQLGLLE